MQKNDATEIDIRNERNNGPVLLKYLSDTGSQVWCRCRFGVTGNFRCFLVAFLLLLDYGSGRFFWSVFDLSRSFLKPTKPAFRENRKLLSAPQSTAYFIVPGTAITTSRPASRNSISEAPSKRTSMKMRFHSKNAYFVYAEID